MRRVGSQCALGCNADLQWAGQGTQHWQRSTLHLAQLVCTYVCVKGPISTQTLSMPHHPEASHH